MITCSVCGSLNEAEAKFCGTCGSKLEPAPAAEAEVPTAKAPPAQAPTPRPAPPPASPPPAPTPSPAPASSKGPASGAQPAPAAAAPVVPAAPETTITCKVCGTSNDIARDFCRKCASPLRPGPVQKPPSPLNRRFWITFGLSALVGVAVVVGGAWLLQPPSANAGTPITVTDRDGDQLQFQVQPGTAPQPLKTLPITSTIQLVSAKQAVASFEPSPDGKAPWWNDTVPRIPPVSQFDGGPLQKVNCVMASGAMLARLAYGIVTTGSQLRGLQRDQEGASNYSDLETAVETGWGVHFFKGSVTPLQFRALLWGGAGAVVGVTYGEIPEGVRLQRSFTGNHSIYVDAFRPDGPDGPAAYYVMDPIGHTWAGYKGGWWPAADVERAALVHSGGIMSATWAFAGGVVPKDHPILPKNAYPSNPSPSIGPTVAPTVAPSFQSGDPMPSGDLTLNTDPPIGDPPPDTPQWTIPDFSTNLYLVDPNPGLPVCAVVPAPAGCPRGIVGIIDVGGVTIPVATSPPSVVQFLWANAIAPGTYQIIFSAPPDSQQSLWVWNTAGGGSLQQATVDQGIIGGSLVSVATVVGDPTSNYSFVATATGAGLSAISSVGSLTVKQ